MNSLSLLGEREFIDTPIKNYVTQINGSTLTTGGVLPGKTSLFIRVVLISGTNLSPNSLLIFVAALKCISHMSVLLLDLLNSAARAPVYTLRFANFPLIAAISSTEWGRFRIRCVFSSAVVFRAMSQSMGGGFFVSSC